MLDSVTPTPRTTAGENLSILLIMEDRLLGADLADTLEQIGCRVVLTRDAEGTARTLASLPDLVVIDAAGTEQVGALEVGDRLGRLLGRPIVYLVDDEEQASWVDERSAGACLVKWPFPMAALQGAMRRALAVAEGRSTA